MTGVIDNFWQHLSHARQLRFPFFFRFEWVVNYRFEMFERSLCQ